MDKIVGISLALLILFCILAILFRPFENYLVPKDLLIIWLSNILSLSISGEGYYRNASCALNMLYLINHTSLIKFCISPLLSSIPLYFNTIKVDVVD